MNIFKKLNVWFKDNDIINKIADYSLVLFVFIMPILIIICIVLKLFYFDYTFLVTASIAFFVPFLIMKFNKHKEEKQNEDFRKIIDESIFNAVRNVA
jgi:hypothetical protein